MPVYADTHAHGNSWRPLCFYPENVNHIVNFASEQLEKKIPYDDVVEMLKEKGVNEKLADEVVHTMINNENSEKSGSGFSALIWFLVFIGGIAYTIYSYESAQAGGTYVIAWGAILFGFINMLKAL